jgi:hypothetical protein
MTDLSQIKPSPVSPALADRLVGVAANNVDWLYTLSQVQRAIVSAIQQAGPPAVANLASGQFGVFKDTANGNVILVYNDGGNLLGTPLTPVTILDAHSDNFGTFNLFDHQGGPYWAGQNAWNVGSLTNAQFSQTVTAYPITFPNNVILSWKYPTTPVSGNVYSYPEIIFGTQAGGAFGGPPPTTPPPKQLSSFANLSVAYEVSLNFTTGDDGNFLIETWVQTTPNVPGSNVSELQFLARPTTAVIGQVLGWADHFNYSAGGFNAYVAANPSRTLIQVMPVTAANGTTSQSMANGPQIMPILGVIQAIITQGWFAGTKYISGFEFGIEVAKNAGSMSINNINWTWN